MSLNNRSYRHEIAFALTFVMFVTSLSCDLNRSRKNGKRNPNTQPSRDEAVSPPQKRESTGASDSHPSAKPDAKTQDGITFIGKVIAVADGDTITILTEDFRERKIRFNGIDAPEKSQVFGQKSKQNLSRLIFGKTVEIIVTKQDRYGRSVGKVILGEEDVGLRQIADGFAWHFKKYENEQSAGDRIAYAETEERARRQKIGLWSHDNHVPPWIWREAKR
ncbi:MAG: thermonuclease family protein [Pyrinomonadaceae bacterium]